jgi:hypothetical protein
LKNNKINKPYKKALKDYRSMDDDKFFSYYHFNKKDGTLLRSSVRCYKFGQLLLKLQKLGK